MSQRPRDQPKKKGRGTERGWANRAWTEIGKNWACLTALLHNRTSILFTDIVWGITGGTGKEEILAFTLGEGEGANKTGDAKR